ncbi:cyclin-dependent kinase G-1-like [Triticum dicoccoides]|nr:cyclin-dependent kinase G-1-like [Triticum dicoccoides]
MDIMFDADGIDMPTFDLSWTRRRRRFAADQTRRAYTTLNEQFDAYTGAIWQPYTQEAIDARYPVGFSVLCTRDADYWMTKSMIIFDVFVEEMAQQRVMRQFGLLQLETPPSIEVPLHRDIHRITKKGINRTATEWLYRVQSYVTQWETCQPINSLDPQNFINESIIEILDVATDAETRDVFLVTELVADGRTLRESLWRPVSEDVTRVMMEQLLDAAKNIHGAGVIHRDFKPENVMVGFFGGLKVGDFGSAMRAKPAGVPYEECCVGTLIYTSPEQLEGNRYYGQAVDMWALGCIMAEMLAGATLFVADTEEELLAEIYKLRDQITSTGKLDLEFFEELSEAGREVLTGLLAFNPAERITAAEALEHRWFSKPKGAEHPGFVSLKS